MSKTKSYSGASLHNPVHNTVDCFLSPIDKKDQSRIGAGSIDVSYAFRFLIGPDPFVLLNLTRIILGQTHTSDNSVLGMVSLHLTIDIKAGSFVLKENSLL